MLSFVCFVRVLLQECGLLALAQKGDPVVKYFEVPEEKDKGAVDV